MTLVRSADDDDYAQLSRFQCCGPGRPDYEVEVERFVQQSLLWRSQNPDVEIYVMEIDGEIVATLGCEPDGEGVYVNYIAVQSVHHKQGLGETMFRAVLDSFPADTYVSWLVAPANHGSHHLSVKLGATETQPPEVVPYMLYMLVT